jgi:hypothetical protein
MLCSGDAVPGSRVGNSPTLVQSDRGLTTLVQSQRSVVQSSLLDSDHGAKPRIAV